jgi:DNA-binding Lrp family transcriptional regulator
MTKNEKELLTILDKNPDISMKEMLNRTAYTWKSTVSERIAQLKKERVLLGPIYDIDYGKLSRNPLHKLHCIIETRQDFETVISYLCLIDSMNWVYPVLSPYKDLLNVAFFSSNNSETTALLQLLKDNDIITDYIVRTYCQRRMEQNANLFGDPVPSLDNLLDPCVLPDASLGEHDINWNECDISILQYFGTGYKNMKLTEILKKEKESKKSWTYEQVKYSRQKMVKNQLLRKLYIVLPFQRSQCAGFKLFLRTDNTALTQRILYNFARGGRVYKEYVLCEEWGQITCICHPKFLTGLMHGLDRIDEITGKELYQLRAVPRGSPLYNQSPKLLYFDVETQTLEYPYHVYREKIKEKLENELE